MQTHKNGQNMIRNNVIIGVNINIDRFQKKHAIKSPYLIYSIDLFGSYSKMSSQFIFEILFISNKNTIDFTFLFFFKLSSKFVIIIPLNSSILKIIRVYPKIRIDIKHNAGESIKKIIFIGKLINFINESGRLKVSSNIY